MINDDGMKKLFDKTDVLDVVDLRNLTKLLWKQREFFKKTFDIIGDSIVVINGRGEILYGNKAACDLLGIRSLKQFDVLWKYIPEFVAFADFDAAAIEANNSFFSKEIKVSYPRKSILNAVITHGGEDMFVLRIIDVTEERVSSERTINDEKISSITLLASGVAHEIGNPLTAIGLRLQLMQRQSKFVRDIDERAKLEESIGVCLGEISRLDGIVRNFLHAVRPQRPKMVDIALDEVLCGVISLMEAEFRSLNIKIVNNVKKLPLIFGDFAQLKQVFFNVLKNSCEAISGGGTIVIDGISSDSDAILIFTDDGVGIPSEVFDKIFHPYFSTKEDGNGLGMVVVERILREHGATIDIASTKNVGTKIALSFPRKDKNVPLLHSTGGGDRRKSAHQAQDS